MGLRTQRYGPEVTRRWPSVRICRLAAKCAAERTVDPCKHRDADGARGNAEPSNRIRQRNQGPQDPFRPDQIRPERRDSNQAGDYSQSDVQLALDPPNPARLKRLPVAVDPHDESSEEDHTESDTKRRVDMPTHHRQSIMSPVPTQPLEANGRLRHTTRA